MKYISWDKSKGKWRVSTPMRGEIKPIQKRFSNKSDAIDFLNTFLEQNTFPKIQRKQLRKEVCFKCEVCNQIVVRKSWHFKQNLEKKQHLVCGLSCSAIAQKGYKMYTKKQREKIIQKNKKTYLKNREKTKEFREYQNKYARDVRRPNKYGEYAEVYKVYREILKQNGDKRIA